MPRVINGNLMDGVVHSYVPADTLEIDPSLAIWDGPREPLDHVTYEVIRHNLWNINEEHGNTIIRVSGSPISSFGRDFNPCVMNALGDFIFFGPYLQFHAGMQDLTVKWILENRSSNPGIRDGDMFLHNDPWVGTSHQQDAATMCPVFWDGKLFCWVGSTLHFPDLGGPTPGGWCPEAESVFDEPQPLPPVRIVECGVLRHDLEAMWTRRSRMPQTVALDLRAVIAGNTVARDRILALIRRHGAGKVSAAMERIVDDSEAAFLRKIRRIPDGTWSAQSFIEGALPGDRNTYRGVLTMRKEGDTLTFSSAGTDPQAGTLNATYAGWRGGILSVVNPLLCFDSLFAIGGALRHIRFEPEPGTLGCATYPASVSNAGGIGVEFWLSLANAAIAKFMACDEELRHELTCVTGCSIWPVSSFSGLNQWGEFFSYILLEWFDAPMGAQPWRDGIHSSGTFWGPLQIAPNVEQTEQVAPILYLYRRELENSASAGKRIGGAGTALAFVVHGSDEITHQVAASGVAVPTSPGSSGGRPGVTTTYRFGTGTRIRDWFQEGRLPDSIADLGGSTRLLDPNEGNLRQGPDDIYEIWCCTSGAWGDPIDRDPESVATDVRDGYFSQSAAFSLFGVELDGRGDVDGAATLARRHAIRRERIGRDPVEFAVRPAPAGERILRVGEHLEVVRRGGAPVYACGRCAHVLGPTTANYKLACASRDMQFQELGPLFNDPSEFIDDAMVYREFYCPGCGTALEGEVAREAEPPFHDMSLLIGDGVGPAVGN